MFKYITFIFIMIFSLTVQAQVVTEHLKVTDSKCVLTAKESTTGSTVVGTGVGAAAGGFIGYLIGGRSGAKAGAALGGGTGALVGHNSGSEAYSCKILVERKNTKYLLHVDADKKITAGYTYSFVIQNDQPIDIF